MKRKIRNRGIYYTLYSRRMNRVDLGANIVLARFFAVPARDAPFIIHSKYYPYMRVCCVNSRELKEKNKKEK